MLRRALFSMMALVLAIGAGELLLRMSHRQPFLHSLADDFRLQDNPDAPLIRHYPFVRPDPQFGYRLTPGSYPLRAGEDITTVSISPQGLRGTRTYPPRAPASTQRIAAIGCSFTFGHGVGDGQSWPSQLEALLPDSQVLNGGVPGYGLDQTLLRYSDENGPLASADLVVLGYVPFTEMRLVADVSPFPGVAFPKPRFELHGQRLERVEAPDTPDVDPSHLDQFGRRLGLLGRLCLASRFVDALAAPRATSRQTQVSNLLELSTRLVLEIRDVARRRGAALIVVVMPSRPLFKRERARAGSSTDLVLRLREAGLTIINPSPGLVEHARQQGLAALFAGDAEHPSALYNAAVAEALAAHLAD